ncbi:MAG TPA: sensor domain-containing diguanylate cyclase [Acidimicrobiales bacterium]|nr:sensor domain-containing diguanylate cyclase [Acidimicrobiales bacterium]
MAVGEPLDPDVLARLLPFVGESLMVVSEDGTVLHHLAPPEGILGLGAKQAGANVFTHMHPDDLPKMVQMSVGILDTEPGWESRGSMRLQMADGTYRRHEVFVSNQLHDPVLKGIVVRTMRLDDAVPPDDYVPNDGDLIESMAEAMPVAIVLLDPWGRALYANRRAQELLELDLNEMQACGLEGLQHVIRELGGSIGERVVQVVGGDRVLEAHLTSHAGVGGRVANIAITLTDVTNRVRAEADLNRRASHDELTGLPNRAAIIDTLGVLLAARPDDVTVVYCDLDGFKLVNDRLGHAVGDRVLAHVASVLRGAVREGDLVGRIGGDEFVFVCESLDDGELAELRDRVAACLGGAEMPDAPHVTASLGVARGRIGDTARDILHRADVAMYAAKRATQHV